MICYALQLVHCGRDFPIAKLSSGSLVSEPSVRPECQISDWSLWALHQGKDASINHMLTGGCGFPAHSFIDQEFENVFDMGCQQEQRDLRSLSSATNY